MQKECVHCGITFDLNSRHKKQVGGKINECPDCVEEFETEQTVKYLGTITEDGADLNIIHCKTEEDRHKFSNLWKNGDSMDDTKEVKTVQRSIDVIDTTTGTLPVELDNKKQSKR